MVTACHLGFANAKVHISHVFSYLHEATTPTHYQRSHGTNFYNFCPTPTPVRVISPFVSLAHLALTAWRFKKGPVSDVDGNEVREKCFSISK